MDPRSKYNHALELGTASLVRSPTRKRAVFADDTPLDVSGADARDFSPIDV